MVRRKRGRKSRVGKEDGREGGGGGGKEGKEEEGRREWSRHSKGAMPKLN